MILQEWADRHGIHPDAVDDLRRQLTGSAEPVEPHDLKTEAGVQSQIRLNASAVGARLWRNNNGAAFDAAGRVVRYGLANESKVVSKKIKSSDLIGIRPVVITADMVGKVFGQFVAVEVKKPGWVYSGTERETAQLKFIQIITGLGGHAKFSNDPKETIL